MRRAAARGAIDFRGADLQDRNFWRRVGLAARTIYEDDEAELAKIECHRALAVMQGAIAKGAFDSDVGAYVDAEVERVRAWLQPWAAAERAARSRSVVREMEEEWARTWGDPDAPETRARIEEACRALRGAP